MSEQLDPEPADRLLVIGVGNPYRQDDGVGPHLAQAVRKRGPAFARVIEHPGDGAALMQLWEPGDAVVLFDAVSSGQPPGTISFLDVHRQRIPASYFNYSTHAFSVAEAIEVSRVLGRLPQFFHIYGIEGACFGAGEGLSPRVAEAVSNLLPEVLQSLRQIPVRKQPGADRRAYA